MSKILSSNANRVTRMHSSRMEDVKLAEYACEPLYPPGVQLSALQQCSLSDILADLYGRNYRIPTRSHSVLSAADEETFLDERYYGAETYGEIMPEGFLDILWKVGAKPGDVIYDLGSGIGKLLAISRLLGLKAVGIELSRARCEVAWPRLAELEACATRHDFPVAPQGSAECRCESMFDTDLANVDIVFFCSLMFDREMVAKVAHLARRMKSGARIVSHHNFDIFGVAFKEVGTINVPASWKAASTMMIHEVVKSEA